LQGGKKLSKEEEWQKCGGPIRRSINRRVDAPQKPKKFSKKLKESRLGRKKKYVDKTPNEKIGKGA